MEKWTRTLDDINLTEVEEMARGSGPRPSSDRQLHLNMLRKKIQQQRGMVAKLSRDDLENQHLHLLEELEVLKKDSNTKDLYIKRLSTKILRLQRSENLVRDEGNKSLNGSLRLEMEQKIKNLENQLKMTKVYGTPLPGRKGSRTPDLTSLNVAGKGQLDALRQQIQILEIQLKEERDVHAQSVKELQEEIDQTKQKMSTDNARTTMLENMEMTRLTRELSKTTQELQMLKSDYGDIRPKFEELQINKIILTREKESLKWEVDRHVQNLDNLERQLRESREKALQGAHDQERVARLENELARLRRSEPQALLVRPVENDQHHVQRNRVADDILHDQIKNLEAELDKEYKAGQELRKRLTDREQEMEKVLKDITELRSAHVLLTKECEELRLRIHDHIHVAPRETEGWVRLPTNLRNDDFEKAVRLFTAFQLRRDVGSVTEALSADVHPVRAAQAVTDEIDSLKRDISQLNQELKTAREQLRKSRDVFSTENMQNQRAYNDMQAEIDRARSEISNLRQNLDEKHRELAQKSKLVDDLQRQLREIAEGTVIYDLEEDGVDQSRFSADNIVLQHGDNLLQLHFGPFAFNQEFFAQADALRISKWRLKWSVFGEDMFAQDSEQIRPDFDFTAVHCITMDERIMHDIAEGFIRVEIVGIRNDFSRAFAFATFSCRKLLSESYRKLNRIRGEVPLVSQFNIGSDFGIMVYWMRMKFDVRQTLALFKARQKALSYVDDNDSSQPNPDQLWMQERGPMANLLHIEISNCQNVKALSSSSPPNSCVLYQFFNGKTTYTPTILSSENPRFEHRATFRIMEDDDTDRYLRQNKLDFYVTDTKDHNDDHFLGYCQISLSELMDHPVLDREIQLYAPSERPNGTLTVSLYWERPYGKRSQNGDYPAAHVPNLSARVNRASLTPRGSLISVTHSARLLKITSNNPRPTSPHRQHTTEDISLTQKVGNEPQPAPRKSTLTRPEMVASAALQADSQKGNDYFSPPSSSNYRAVGQSNNVSENRIVRRETRERTTGQQDKAKNESGRSQRGSSADRILDRASNQDSVSARKSQRNVSPRNPLSSRSNTQSDKQSTIVPAMEPTGTSDNQPASARDLDTPRRPARRARETPRSTRSEGIVSSRGTGTDSAVEGGGDAPTLPQSPNNIQTVRAELHLVPNGQTPVTRKTSAPSVVGHVQTVSPAKFPEDSIAIIVHSLYFVSDAPVLNDSRVGEIFVVIQFLSVEYESPLAVVKPSVPNKELTFEFQKVLPMNAENHSDERKHVFAVLNSSPSGRIQFSVYMQPDDQESDSELIGVAALSLNRLLIKEQDAIGAELKLINPSDRGLAIGYVKVTVHAVDVLLDIRREYGQTV